MIRRPQVLESKEANEKDFPVSKLPRSAEFGNYVPRRGSQTLSIH